MWKKMKRDNSDDDLVEEKWGWFDQIIILKPKNIVRIIQYQ